MRFCTVQASDNCVESGVEDLREAGARARDLPSRTRSGRRAPILAGLRSNEGTGCPALWLPDLKNATQLPGASSLCDIQRDICQGKTKLCLLFCVALKLVGHHSGLKGHSGLASPALLFQIESFHLKGWLPPPHASCQVTVCPWPRSQWEQRHASPNSLFLPPLSLLNLFSLASF